jgi:hypothetical protein
MSLRRGLTKIRVSRLGGLSLKSNQRNAPLKWRAKGTNEAMEAAHRAGRTGKRKVTNRFEAVTCQACGRRTARKSRQQRYCSDRCRKFAARELEARTAVKSPSGYQDSGPVREPIISPNKNKAVQKAKSGSSIPLNVLGGYRWPNAVRVDRELVRKIVRAEIGDNR